MPANQIKHDAESGKGSKKSLEKDWDEAKKIVKDEYGEEKWPVVQKIYQNKRDASVVDSAVSRILEDERG